MKHLLVFLSITLIMLTSCKKDEDKIVEVQLFQNHVDLKSSNSFQIQTVVPDTNLVFSSNNEFVATVNPSGLVTAIRIGEANIEVANDQSKAILSVTVTPQSTLYDEPICDWTLNRSQVIEKEGEPFHQLETSIGYMVDNNASPMKVYVFDDQDKLIGSSVIVSKLFSSELDIFLLERYKRFYELPGRYYIDALTFETANKVVYIEDYDEDYKILVYASTDLSLKISDNFLSKVKRQFRNAIRRKH